MIPLFPRRDFEVPLSLCELPLYPDASALRLSMRAEVTG